MTRLEALIASVAAASALACGSLLGVDEFEVNRVDNPCGALEVPGATGCVAVGVSECAAGFLSDGAGGCVPRQPAEACPPGRFAPPDFTECNVIGLLNCSAGPFPKPAELQGEVRYVSPQAPAGGDGSEERPLRTIAEALALVQVPLTIVLSGGEHHGSVDLSEREASVRLVGLCASETFLVPEPGAPAVVFGDGADGSTLESLAIRGGSAGVVAVAASGLRLEGVWIHDVAGPGVVIEDIPGRADMELDHVLIERVLDAGVLATGAKVSFRVGVIRDVNPLYEGGRGLGLSVSASAAFTGLDPGARTGGELTLFGSTIERTTQAAVRIEESAALVEGAWIRDVAPDELGFARGIDVRGSATFSVAGELTLSGSLIEQTAEAGVRVWNANATIAQTVIREIARDATRRCSGAGIGASYGLLGEEATEPRLVVRSSLIEKVSGSPFDLEGGAARMERSRVFVGQEQCSGAALRARASATGAAKLELSESRLDGGSPAIEAPGQQLVLDDSALACSSPVLEFGQISGAESSLCGCDGIWHACSFRLPEARTPPPLPCEASSDTTCLRLCLQNLGNQGTVRDATIWVFDRPEVGGVLTDADGCTELPGVPRLEPFAVAAAARGYGPGLAMAAPFDAPYTEPVRNSLIALATFPFFVAQVPGGVDLRKGTLAAVRVCSEPGVPGFPCPPLPASTVELTPDPSAVRLYFSANNQADADLDQTEGADVVFANVHPGKQRVKVTPPAAERCTVNAWGWAEDERNTFRIHIEPGFAQSVAEVVCAE